MDSKKITAISLLNEYLKRIEKYNGLTTTVALNAIVVLNPNAMIEAYDSDQRRKEGRILSPLDGIPYTVKDSYLVKGLTAAAGSHAFKDLIAGHSAFVIDRLSKAGAICIGKTNMPPMANGGMQRGVYGRAESPYNKAYLTAPFASGSSNGAASATSASFSSFGLAEETWSSGRGPASNNGLCAYTPSRGLISIRGNWPLTPTMDVIVPYTRTMTDLLEVLDVIVAEDNEKRGDFWRLQPWVKIPKLSSLRPRSYLSLVKDTAFLKGKCLGVPRMYINGDPLAGSSNSVSIGGATGKKIITRPSIMKLWDETCRKLQLLGCKVVEVDFPLVTNYEGDRSGAPNILNRGLIPKEFLHSESWDLSIWALDDFLRYNNDPSIPNLGSADPSKISLRDPGSLPNNEGRLAVDMSKYIEIAKEKLTHWKDLSYLQAGLLGLEKTRKIDLEDWMESLHLDAVIFPTVADIAPSDSDINPKSSNIAWSNGVWVANGNLAIRHMGVPTVTLPMGVLEDIAMPVGITFAGRAYDDSKLLALGSAFESMGSKRTPPPLTPHIKP